LLRLAGDYQLEPVQPPLAEPVLVQERVITLVAGSFEIVNVLPDFDVAVTS
jgi:hypothetical protein